MNMMAVWARKPSVITVLSPSRCERIVMGLGAISVKHEITLKDYDDAPPRRQHGALNIALMFQDGNVWHRRRLLQKY